jgi:hypothetical protein
VASTAEGKGIHVINDHAKYKEWEFVYDLKKDKTVVGAAAVNQQQQRAAANAAGTNSPPLREQCFWREQLSGQAPARSVPLRRVPRALQRLLSRPRNTVLRPLRRLSSFFR